MIPRRLALFLVGVLSLGCAALADEANLVRNPGLEQPIAEEWAKRTPDDEARTLTWDGQQARTGAHSLKIANRKQTLSRWRQGHDASIKPAVGQELKLEGWVRTDAPDRSSAFLRLFIQAKSGATLAELRSNAVSGRSDWQRVVRYATVPANADHVMVYAELDGEGAAWFDDLALTAVVRPARPPQPKDILLVTDAPSDSPPLAGIRLAAGERLYSAMEPKAFKTPLPEGIRFIVALVHQWPQDGELWPGLQSFAQRGGVVVMDLSNFAAANGLALRSEPFAGLPRIRTTFDGPAGRYDIAVACLDSYLSISDMYLLVNDRVVDHWLLDAPMKEEDQRKAVTRTVKGCSLEPGDTLSVCASQSGMEACAVDKFTLTATDGSRQTVIEAEDMALADGYGVTTRLSPMAKGVAVNRSQVPTKRIEIVAESAVTRGFERGQALFWHGGERRQAVGDTPALSGATVLARWEDGGAVAVEQTLGRGRIVALDLMGAPEPYWGRPGGLNKYVFLGNAMGPGVRFGRYFPKKFTYAELVDEMRRLATSAPGVRLADEGPASEGHRIWSLNFGDPGKPMFFLSAATHGSEWEPGYGLLCLARYLAAHPEERIVDLSRYSVKIVPVLSPWAYERHRRHTPQQIDPNRNSDYGWQEYTHTRDTTGDGQYGPGDYAWKGDAPFCLPETQTYKKIMDENTIHCAVEFHCPAWFISMPSTARPDNVDRMETARWLFAGEFTPRLVFQHNYARRIEPYTLGRATWMGRTPFLLQYGARGRYGLLVELPGGGTQTYATLILSEMAAATGWAALQAYADREW